MPAPPAGPALAHAPLRLLLALVLLLGTAGAAGAHVTELAVLRLSEFAEGRFAITWEANPAADLGTPTAPVFPSHCTPSDGVVLDCGEDGLVGPLGFETLGTGQAAAMFKIRYLDGQARVYTVTPAAPVVRVGASFDAGSWAGIAEIAGSYLVIGIDHIMKGVDHLLFVLGLLWIANGRWALLKTITAFTVAHTVSLGAVTFGWIGVPEDFVNAMIALSIVFIGVEAVHAHAGRRTWAQGYPWAIAFGFGLLHGLGFANALVDLGLPEAAVPVALVAFNIGVEIGQIAFVLLVLSILWSWRVMRVTWPGWSTLAPAYAIGGLGAFWFCERSTNLLGG